MTATLAVAEGLSAGNHAALSIVWFVAYLAIPAAFTWFVVEYYGLPYLGSPIRRVAFVLPVVVGIAGGTARVLSPAAVSPVPRAGAGSRRRDPPTRPSSPSPGRPGS